MIYPVPIVEEVVVQGDAIYIPSTVGEVHDFLGSMVISIPEFTVLDLPFDEAFMMLNVSLGRIRDKVGEEKYNQLKAMAEQAKEFYLINDARGGAFKLQDMMKLLRKRK